VFACVKKGACDEGAAVAGGLAGCEPGGGEMGEGGGRVLTPTIATFFM